MRNSSKPPLLVLIGNPRLRDRIRIAFRMGASSRVLGRVVFETNWHQLSALGARHPGSPAVVDTFSEGPKGSPAESWGMHANNRSILPVIWYGPSDHLGRRRLRRAGITCEAHLLPGVNDDLESIDRAILRSIGAHSTHHLRELAKGATHPLAYEMLDHALGLATGRCTVPDLAARVGRKRRTLEGRCAALRIPSPKRIIALARIFTVHRLAEWSRQPYSGVARAIGFSDRSNYRRLVCGVLGCGPSMVQRLGGSDYIAREILKRLGC